MPRSDADAPDEARSRTAETAARFSDDVFLRKHGFRIVARPDIWTAIWGRHGREYTFYEAISVARWEEENRV